MNSVVAQAVAVVEQARCLELAESQSVKGLYRIGADQKALPGILRDLGRAIEAFDRATGVSDDPEAVLGSVMRYVVDRGIDPAALVKHLNRLPSPSAPSAGMDGGDIDRLSVPRLVPKPGEVGAPDRVANMTVDQSNSLTRSGPQDVAAKFAKGEGPTDQFAVDFALSDVELGGDDARGLAAMAAMLRPASDRTAVPAPKPPSGPDVDRVDGRDLSRDLAKELDALGARIERIFAQVGDTPRMRGLMAQFAGMRERMVMDTGVGGEVTFEMTAGVVAAIGRLEEEVSDIEAEVEAEAGLALPAPGRR